MLNVQIFVYVLWAIICLSCIYGLVRFKNYCYIVYLNGKIQGPERYFFPLGNILDLACEHELLFKKFRLWGRNYFPVYSIMSYPTPSVNIIGPDDIEKVISSTKNMTKSQVYVFLQKWLKEGLLTSSGAKWQTRRKLLTPAFHFSILREFLSIFHKETQQLVRHFEEMSVNEKSVNIIPIVTKFTLYTINETSLGVQLNVCNEEDTQYKNAILEIGKLFMHRITRPWLQPHYLYYYFTSFGHKERKLINILQNFTSNIISKKINEVESSGTETISDTSASYSGRKRMAMLDLLIKAKNQDGQIDIDGIKEEVDTFMFEGHDTTSMAICFCLLLLASNREIQDKIVKEIHEVIGDGDEEPTYQNLVQLKYLENCIKESLRLYPSVPLIGRISDENIVTSQGDLIPKGSVINIHIFDLHRNANIYEDPDKFDPDRFLPENTQNRHPFAYLPFSAGPRNCIGQKFAMLELKTAICGVLKHFILEPVDTPETVKITIDLVLRPVNEIRLKFIKRK